MLKFGNELTYLAPESAEDFEELAEETEVELRTAATTGSSRLLQVIYEEDDGKVGPLLYTETFIRKNCLLRYFKTQDETNLLRLSCRRVLKFSKMLLG